jgi:hypothetical protein
MADDEIVLVCLPADRPPGDPSSTREYCMECADPVWMSDHTKRFWNDNPSAQVMCAPCAVEHEDFVEVEGAVPGDEIGEALQRMLPMSKIIQMMRSIYRRDP